MNNAVFGKCKQNMRKHTDFKLVTTLAKRNYLVSESNCHATKTFSEIVLHIVMKKTHI